MHSAPIGKKVYEWANYTGKKKLKNPMEAMKINFLKKSKNHLADRTNEQDAKDIQIMSKVYIRRLGWNTKALVFF